jgi:hypothetical protein
MIGSGTLVRGGAVPRRFVRGILPLACMALLFAALPLWAVDAKPSLRDVPEIEDALFVIAVANELDKKCDSINGRRLKGFNALLELRRRANQLGYSDAEIRAYVEADAEKARMRDKGQKFLAANGVVYGKPETFCAFGRAEIEKSSAIGALLRAR